MAKLCATILASSMLLGASAAHAEFAILEFSTGKKQSLTNTFEKSLSTYLYGENKPKQPEIKNPDVRDFLINVTKK